jgi:hydroxymethylglutaryl-CoA lyase
MKLRARSISIFEVGPRDGLQSQSQILSLEAREELVLRLARAGLQDIEVGSFVRDDRIPQLAQTSELMARLDRHRRELQKLKTRLWAFVPNMRGLEAALDTSVDGVSLFVATSETFCQRNVNRSQKELLGELELLIPKVRKAKREVRVYLSTITHCPYEGAIRPSKVQKLVHALADMGVKEIALGDTTGHSTPLEIEKLLELLMKKYKSSLFAMHLHDTRALALANTVTALRMGVRKIDAAVGGLGGCPYAPGAAGNLATEDLVYMLDAMGVLKNDVSLVDVANTSKWLETQLGYALPSKVLKTLYP